MTCYGCRYCYSVEVLYVKQLRPTVLRYEIHDGWRPGTIKVKIGDNQILFILTLKYHFQVLQRNFKADCIYNNLMLICFKSGGFL